MQPDKNIPSGNPGYETRDASLKLAVWIGLGLVILCLLAFVTMRGLYDSLSEAEAARQPPPSALRPEGETQPPEPRLATHPTRPLRELRAEEDVVLQGYGWLDEVTGTVHIPIERAIDLTLERGLPHEATGQDGRRSAP
ncbi:MAG: hypothetical protein PVF68_14065 [Acidobacteriota bacterium]|jgi:hypothetical protein